MEILDNTYDYELGEHHFDSNLVVKRISVTTTPIEDAVMEDYEHHIDIQIPLNENEEINVYDSKMALKKMQYDFHKDVTFYSKPGSLISSSYVKPGYFIMIMPKEIHQPQISYRTPYVLEKLPMFI